MFKQILVPVDGSDTSNLALRDALTFAKDQDAKLSIVHVYERVVHATSEGVVDLTQAMRDEGERILAEALTKAREAGVEVRTVLVDADGRRVPAAIVDEAVALRADLIIMGTHGRRGFEHLMLGSVAEGVARRATVPVLLIRGK